MIRHRIKKYMLIALFLLTTPAYGEDMSQQHPKSSLFIHYGLTFASENNKLLEDFADLTGYSIGDLSLSGTIGADIKLQYSDNLRWNISIAYLNGTVHEKNNEYFNESYGSGSRDITDKIGLYSFPVFIAAEYVPIKEQFMTYAGIGLGAVIDYIFWEETVYSTYAYDPRTGGEMYNSLMLSPALNLYSGVELNFDSNNKLRFIQGIFIEAGISYTYRRAALFENVADQFPERNFEWDTGYPIYPFIIGIKFGVTFNLTTV